jgi:hypothetical protein
MERNISQGITLGKGKKVSGRRRTESGMRAMEVKMQVAGLQDAAKAIAR